MVVAIKKWLMAKVRLWLDFYTIQLLLQDWLIPSSFLLTNQFWFSKSLEIKWRDSGHEIHIIFTKHTQSVKDLNKLNLFKLGYMQGWPGFFSPRAKMKEKFTPRAALVGYVIISAELQKKCLINFCHYYALIEKIWSIFNITVYIFSNAIFL